VASHRGARYHQSNPEVKAEQYRSQCGYHERDDNPANSLGGTDQRPSINKSGIAVHGSCVVRSEDPLCNDGRAIRQRKQDQNLRERYIVHAATVPKKTNLLILTPATNVRFWGGVRRCPLLEANRTFAGSDNIGIAHQRACMTCMNCMPFSHA